MVRNAVLFPAVVVGAIALPACTTAVAGAPTASIQSEVQVTAQFAAEPSGTAITYDPALVPVGAAATVESTSTEGKTTVRLAVKGLVPDRKYGAHAHAKECGAKGDAAGPHFQYQVDPVQPSVDPNYANAKNEIWLDLTTDAQGAGSAQADVAWAFPANRRAHSVIIHAMPTATDPGKAGTAGARAACITVAF